MYKIHDNGIDRDMTSSEIEVLENHRELYPVVSIDSILDKQQQAKSKLEALGLTTDDLKALGL
jgi:hypothetical protein